VQRSARMNGALLISLVVNALLACAVGYLFFAPKPSPSGGGRVGGGTGPKTEKGSTNAVVGLGRIQPTGGLIGVYGIPGEQVISYQVEVGKSVEKGKPLAILSGEKERQLNLEMLDAQIKEAQAIRDAIRESGAAKMADIDAEAQLAEAGLAEDKATIAAKVRAALARKKNAIEEKSRLQKARADGVKVSEQEMNQFTLVVDLADAEMDGAEAQKRKIDLQQTQSKESIKAKKAAVNAETNRAVIQVPLDSLIATKNLATRKTEDAKLVATTGGTVLRILTQVGETITNQPVLQIADISRISVITEVYETDVTRLREWLSKDKVVNVEIDASSVLGTSTDNKQIKGKLRRLDQVSSVIAKNVLTPLGPREEADRRVVEVTVELDSNQGLENFIGVQLQTKFLAPGTK